MNLLTIFEKFKETCRVHPRGMIVGLMLLGLLGISLEFLDFVTLNKPQAGKNFVAGNGMEMVWVAPINGWVGKYLVTQEEWEKVMGNNPSFHKAVRHAVDFVSWDDAQAFCKKLTKEDQQRGTLSAQRHYQLPTNAQYNVFVGDASYDDSLTSLNLEQSCPSEVGTTKPNKFGLYDTRGYLWEWCEDWYQNSMNDPALVKQDSIEDGGGHQYRVRRGGARPRCPDSYCYADNPYNRSGNIGIRCVLLAKNSSL